jgi:hypothetical protein
MEAFLYNLIIKHTDSIIVIIAFGFMYLKISFLTSKVDDLKRSHDRHIDYHLCQPITKGE